MTPGNVSLAFSIPLAAAGGKVLISPAATGVVSGPINPATTGVVSGPTIVTP